MVFWGHNTLLVNADVAHRRYISHKDTIVALGLPDWIQRMESQMQSELINVAYIFFMQALGYSRRAESAVLLTGTPQ